MSIHFTRPVVEPPASNGVLLSGKREEERLIKIANEREPQIPYDHVLSPLFLIVTFPWINLAHDWWKGDF